MKSALKSQNLSFLVIKREAPQHSKGASPKLGDVLSGGLSEGLSWEGEASFDGPAGLLGRFVCCFDLQAAKHLGAKISHRHVKIYK